LLEAVEFAGALPVLLTRLKGLRLTERPRYRDVFHFRGLEGLGVEWA
jgi:cytochrome P450